MSAAKKVFFLGYSLPEADYHARLHPLRCGFHNQTEGELDKRNRRKNPTGPAEVIIVNPDCEAARRIKESVSPGHKCWWFPTPIEDPDLRWDLPSLGLHPDHSRKRCDKPADPTSIGHLSKEPSDGQQCGIDRNNESQKGDLHTSGDHKLPRGVGKFLVDMDSRHGVYSFSVAKSWRPEIGELFGVLLSAGKSGGDTHPVASFFVPIGELAYLISGHDLSGCHTPAVFVDLVRFEGQPASRLTKEGQNLGHLCGQDPNLKQRNQQFADFASVVGRATNSLRYGMCPPQWEGLVERFQYNIAIWC